MGDVQQSVRAAQEALRAAQREEVARNSREREPQRKIAEQQAKIDALHKVQTALDQWGASLSLVASVRRNARN